MLKREKFWGKIVPEDYYNSNPEEYVRYIKLIQEELETRKLQREEFRVLFMGIVTGLLGAATGAAAIWKWWF